MTSADVRSHLSALVESLPADGAVTVPVLWLRQLVAGSTDPERGLLTPAQAAARMGVQVSWLYRHTTLPFRRKLSHRQLMFDPAGLDAWLAARNGKS